MPCFIKYVNGGSVIEIFYWYDLDLYSERTSDIFSSCFFSTIPKTIGQLYDKTAVFREMSPWGPVLAERTLFSFENGEFSAKEGTRSGATNDVLLSTFGRTDKLFTFFKAEKLSTFAEMRNYVSTANEKVNFDGRNLDTWRTFWQVGKPISR